MGMPVFESAAAIIIPSLCKTSIAALRLFSGRQPASGGRRPMLMLLHLSLRGFGRKDDGIHAQGRRRAMAPRLRTSVMRSEGQTGVRWLGKNKGRGAEVLVFHRRNDGRVPWWLCLRQFEQNFTGTYCKMDLSRQVSRRNFFQFSMGALQQHDFSTAPLLLKPEHRMLAIDHLT
jgi:hypothetical protein